MNNKKKATLFIVLILCVVLISVSSVLYTKHNYNNYITNVSLYLNKKTYDEFSPDCTFEGENNNIINITIDPAFNNCDYNTQRDTILNLTTDINELYDEYNSSQLFKKDVDSNVVIMAGEDSYHCEFQDDDDFIVFKNDKNYKKIDNLHERITVKISADNKYSKYIYKISDIKVLESLLEINDLDECKKEILYSIANIYIKNNDPFAKDILISLKNYKDSKELLSKWNFNHEFDGTWYGSNGSIGSFRRVHEWIITGEYCYNIYSNASTKNGVNKYHLVRDKNNLYIFNSKEDTKDFSKAVFIFKYEADTLTYDYKYDTFSVKKISNDIQLPETSYVPEPSIGMTATEVTTSTWGKPKKINKSTYSWGTREQWVYGDGRYIYLEDGIVTSISTSE